jgi:hypothetical protein
MATYTEIMLVTLICALVALLYFLLYELNMIILSQYKEIKYLEGIVNSRNEHIDILNSARYHLNRCYNFVPKDPNAEA